MAEMATEPKTIPPAVFQKWAGGNNLAIAILFYFYYYICGDIVNNKGMVPNVYGL